MTMRSDAMNDSVIFNLNDTICDAVLSVATHADDTVGDGVTSVRARRCCSQRPCKRCGSNYDTVE